MASFIERYRWLQEKTGHALQSLRVHQLIIALIFIDATLVIIDLGYSAVRPDCHAPGEKPETPLWLEVLSHISLAITSLFLVEIPLTIWSLGVWWYWPFGSITHAWLHLFDAAVIIATFVLEVVLRGKESEAASLLVILRLWRIIKLVTGVTVGAGELDEERAEELERNKEELEETKVQLAACQEQISQLQKRLNPFLSPEE
ncbi:hypothetical protein DFP72DRAFT_870129 [Ephemerocybe angulata]|uniref:Voltage-gated hydrogen channel 1 n=1 Tax=Ephemerocybe angulata TaxID=980116 RepID=A0A8H6MDB5_9AGAR|nr:hypothetical protein DFP72DRAFT_870129 [Tulosesus angulatus]